MPQNQRFNHFWDNMPLTPIQSIELAGYEVLVKRDDLNHPLVQGNKLRKLKYNLQAAQQQACHTLVTFGGAYSNHLLATAYAAKQCGFKSIGVVRGNELANQPGIWSETLSNCQQFGMQLKFVSRADYRLKSASEPFSQIWSELDRPFLIPEGGSNQLAIKGVAELVNEIAEQCHPPPSHLICPLGTGGTLAGLALGVAQQNWECKVVGVAVLKGLHSVKSDLDQWLVEVDKKVDCTVLDDFHGGGYAKNTPELIRFSIAFAQQHGFKLDKIYNSKSFYALAQLLKNQQITAKDRPLIIHTGGLQGGAN